MKNLILAALIASAAAPAFATDYFVVVPVQGRPNAIQVALAAADMPAAPVGAQYSFDFSKSLVVTGDSQFTGAGVAWAVADGMLPAGLALDAVSGVLRGTPVAEGSATFSVAAAYKSRSAKQGYRLAVTGAPKFSAVGAPLLTQLMSSAALGVASDPKVITLKNTGTAAGGMALPPLAGADAAQFRASTTCANVPVNGNCDVSVTWHPTTSTAEATLALGGSSYTYKGSLKQYATWDPANKGAGYILSDNNLTVTNDRSLYTGVRATAGRSTGKWYWEVTVSGLGLTELVGIVKSTVNMNVDRGCFGCTTNGLSNWRAVYPATTSQTIGWSGTTATTSNFAGTTLASKGASLGDTYGFALDVDAQTLTIYYAPVGGACVDHAIMQWKAIGAATWYPVISTGGGTWAASANFGSFAFKCPAPAGFQPLQ